MHDNTAIDGWGDVRKPWNLGSLRYRNENDSLFDSFLVEIRYKLLKCLAMERWNDGARTHNGLQVRSFWR